MNCEDVRKIIPQYFDLSASDEEIKQVEEHLCVCHECRTALGELMDKDSQAKEHKPQESQPEAFEITPQEEAKPLGPASVSKEEEEQESEFNPQEDQISLSDTSLGQNKELLSDDDLKPKQEPESPDEAGSGMEYFPGKDLDKLAEAAKDKIIEDTAKLEPASGLESEPEQVEEVKEEIKEEEPVFVLDEEVKEEEPVIETQEETELVAQEDAEPVFEEDFDQVKEEIEDEAEPLKKQKTVKDKVSFIEYSSLVLGVGILGFFIYLLTKG